MLKEKDFRLSPPPSEAPVGASKNALQETCKAFFDVQALRLRYEVICSFSSCDLI
jgi:hypothetical protein